MLRYVSARSYKKLNTLYRLWNKEYKSLFPLSNQVFKRFIIDDPNLNKDASFVALYDGEAVGFIFIKTWIKESGLLNGNNIAKISLIYVKKELRNMGVGSDLFKLALAEIKKYETINTIIVGKDLRPVLHGVPNELHEAPVFFMNKGFIQKDGTVDMIEVMKANEPINDDRQGLTIRIATEEDRDEILRFCISNNLNIEAYKINDYFENGGSGRRIAISYDNDKLMGIARFNDLNKLNFKINNFMKDKRFASILFIKIDKDYDQRKYETIMINAVKNYLRKRKCKKIALLQVSDVAFYKSLGFSAYKYYLNFEYKIK